MLSFYEYAAWRRITGLPDSATMLNRMGISATVPHEIEVKRMVKRWNKQVLVPATPKPQTRAAQPPDEGGWQSSFRPGAGRQIPPAHE